MEAKVVDDDSPENSLLEENIQYTRSGRQIIPPLASWVGERIVSAVGEGSPRLYYGLRNVDSKGASYLLPGNAYKRHKRQSSSPISEAKNSTPNNSAESYQSLVFEHMSGVKRKNDARNLRSRNKTPNTGNAEHHISLVPRNMAKVKRKNALKNSTNSTLNKFSKSLSPISRQEDRVKRKYVRKTTINSALTESSSSFSPVLSPINAVKSKDVRKNISGEKGNFPLVNLACKKTSHKKPINECNVTSLGAHQSREASNEDPKYFAKEYFRNCINTNRTTLKGKRMIFNALSLGSKEFGDEMHIARKPGIRTILKLGESLDCDHEDSSMSVHTPGNSIHRLSPVSDRVTPVFKSRFSQKEFDTSRAAADAYLSRREKIIKKKPFIKAKAANKVVTGRPLFEKSVKESGNLNLLSRELSKIKSRCESLESSDLMDHYLSDSENSNEVYCNY